MVHGSTNGRFFLFLRLNDIPLCISGYIFLIHLFVDGHLGSFHNLTIMKNAALYIGVQITLRQLFHFLQIFTQMWNCWVI